MIVNPVCWSISEWFYQLIKLKYGGGCQRELNNNINDKIVQPNRHKKKL